jgi:hypothetical protein
MFSCTSARAARVTAPSQPAAAGGCSCSSCFGGPSPSRRPSPSCASRALPGRRAHRPAGCRLASPTVCSWIGGGRDGTGRCAAGRPPSRAWHHFPARPVIAVRLRFGGAVACSGACGCRFFGPPVRSLPRQAPRPASHTRRRPEGARPIWSRPGEAVSQNIAPVRRGSRTPHSQACGARAAAVKTSDCKLGAPEQPPGVAAKSREIAAAHGGEPLDLHFERSRGQGTHRSTRLSSAQRHRRQRQAHCTA